mgnify:CR=1 FL=1
MLQETAGAAAPTRSVAGWDGLSNAGQTGYACAMDRVYERPGPTAEQAVPTARLAAATADPRRVLPLYARTAEVSAELEAAARTLCSRHELRQGDARDLAWIPDGSVHLILTSPPYWTLKEYAGPRGAQLGAIADYERFLDQLDAVWRECARVLVPGGRLAIVVGDVCLSRREHGRHLVVPLHASVQERCRRLGFDNLNPILWHKIANARREAEAPGTALGKPYEPNAIVKNDVEYILFQRQPGGYREPTLAQRLLSVLPAPLHRAWFQQIWTLPGASHPQHPAPFPLALAERLVRMFSFVGDTVLDPFAGTGTTNLAALAWGRSSLGVELVPAYLDAAAARLGEAMGQRVLPGFETWAEDG